MACSVQVTCHVAGILGANCHYAGRSQKKLWSISGACVGVLTCHSGCHLGVHLCSWVRAWRPVMPNHLVLNSRDVSVAQTARVILSVNYFHPFWIPAECLILLRSTRMVSNHVARYQMVSSYMSLSRMVSTSNELSSAHSRKHRTHAIQE